MLRRSAISIHCDSHNCSSHGGVARLLCRASASIAAAHHPFTAAAANDRQTSEWERSSLVTVIRRPLRYPIDWPVTPAAEKGIDVALAIDLVTLGMDKAYDAAILFSSDTDLLPAVETIIQRQLGHIELATWAGARRLRFPNSQLPWCHFVTETEYRTIEDHTDYTKP